MRWLLPEAIEDILPLEAGRVEMLRRGLLDEFSRHGYQYVIPPLLEYVESLLTGSGRDLDLRTFKLVDQASGRAMGIRADITPQVARIDAHLLNRRGVTRLCYSGSVLHTLPAGFHATREPLQIGAELYGHAGLEADIEIIRLLARSLGLADLAASRIDLGHVGLFRALAAEAGLSGSVEEDAFIALQAKDLPSLRQILANAVPGQAKDGLLALAELYGGPEVLARARQVLPPIVAPQLDELQCLADALADLPVSFDLADLRGYHYHNGVVFAAYCQGSPVALALGGRYDKAGAAYGRARPATGFSMDLRELVRLGSKSVGAGAILAPWPGADAVGRALQTRVDSLRAAGETVVVALPGHEGNWTETGCDRQLRERDGQWIIEVLKETGNG
ncbi:ATP phosphoribosyltransferase regulatory subunit [Denitratisoma oestradiolicum]|uniref:ATP phosphoribosyltransferase regulatory subunit n=1 Tax=Denitratisoma oestradiolicum TaxID=311182 RepID=A0A6S6XV67_9PROT|nr:ATP phosphoribosyltransferase regulatory subunit [Denitratisoma oestradiolicum]TWO78988.1 ATP phosphoribosyltransferase regulatory subunit [Denitratisoma oestradiolicum]CAB1369944.1 ATP phosphoribosyltransferase regulatory subunit [Denitratisoma oestradiolicum]